MKMSFSVDYLKPQELGQLSQYKD